MRDIAGKNADTAKELSALTKVHLVEIDATNDDSVKNAFAGTNERSVVVPNCALCHKGLSKS